MIASPIPHDTRVLVAQGDPAAADALRTALEAAGYTVLVAASGSAVLHAVADADARPALLLLDLDLPDQDGLQLLRTLRAQGATMPVLVLTARSEESDTVRALHHGADAYLVRPCGTLELLARLEALLRRAASRAAQPPSRPRPAPAAETGMAPDLVVGDLELFVARREVRKRGRPVALTYREYELFLALARRHGAAVTREALVETVWRGPDFRVDARTIDSYVRTLRRKLEDRPGRPRRILTVWKVGYRVDM